MSTLTIADLHNHSILWYFHLVLVHEARLMGLRAPDTFPTRYAFVEGEVIFRWQIS